MRTDYPNTGMRSTTAKASTERSGTISKKEAIEAHESAFGTLVEDVSKDAGLPGDEVLYHDPMGFVTGGTPVDLRSKMYDRVWSKAFDRFNSEVRKGASVYHAVEQVSKALDRSVFSLPIFVSPDVSITDERDTPVADMLPRVAIDVDTYKTDEQIDHGEAERFYEPGSNDGTDETWVDNDDTYLTHTYDVVPYGRQTAVTDFLQLAANTLRSSRSITEQALMRSQRFYEENQILQGRGDATGFDGYDPNGFAGIPDLVADEGDQIEDAEGSSISTSKVADNITYLRSEGTAYDDIVHVVDHNGFNDLKREKDEVFRYGSPEAGGTVDFGFRALNVDDTPVLESHGLPNEDGERMLVSFDASENLMAMLQDATLHPLARTSPQEDVAVDSYGTFASSSTKRIAVTHNLA